MAPKIRTSSQAETTAEQDLRVCRQTGAQNVEYREKSDVGTVRNYVSFHSLVFRQLILLSI